MRDFIELREIHEVLNHLERLPSSNRKEALVDNLKRKLSSEVVSIPELQREIQRLTGQCASKDRQIEALQLEI
jgi:chaperonin cofactor prefoldin